MSKKKKFTVNLLGKKHQELQEHSSYKDDIKYKNFFSSKQKKKKKQQRHINTDTHNKIYLIIQILKK